MSRCRIGLLFTAAAFACGSAQAVSLSSRGTGQVLLFPYYSAEAGQQTLVTIVNPTSSARALRVRFAESRNGKAVFSLSVYLAANDTWTGAVFAPAAAGAAQFVSFDRSCALATTDAPLAVGVPVTFSTAAYTGANRDWSEAGTPAALAAKLGAPERTRRGFVEVIEMGRLRAGTAALELADELATSPAAACTAIATAWRTSGTSGWSDDASRAIDLPAGGLFGNGAVVDVANGTMLSYVATALDDFYSVATAPGALHAAPASARPALDDARNTPDGARVRVLRSDAAPAIETFPAARAIDAVSLALMATYLRSDYNADPALGAATEWIVAFPTKRFYTDVESDAAVRAPFTDAFRDDGRADERFGAEWRRRNGAPPGILYPVCLDPFGTCPPLPTLAQAVLTIAWSADPRRTTPIFGATPGDDALGIPLSDIAGSLMPTGWASLKFWWEEAQSYPNVLTAPGSGIGYRGLPAIGFGATQLVNTNVVPGVLANYGDATPLWSRLDANPPVATEASR